MKQTYPRWLAVVLSVASFGLEHAAASDAIPARHHITIPTIDLTGEANPADFKRHVVLAGGVDGEDWQHPHMLLLPDGKTLFAVWTHGHGGTCGPLKRSDDGGLTWSGLLDSPDNWHTVKNCPTIHRLADPQGKVRLLVFALGNHGGFVRSVSEDDGRTWSPMSAAGFRGVVPPMTVLAVEGGRKLLTWTHEGGKILNVLQCESTDGGLTWSKQTQPIDKHRFPNCFPCEPEVIRSPDGKQMLMLMRENNRRYNSLLAVSVDEGKSWSKPQELPASLTGDRHTAVYAGDGRLVVMFRDRRPVPGSEANGEKGGQPVWGSGKTTVWVGRYEDIVRGGEGQYLARVLGYGGYGKLERLPDGTILGITYCRYPYDSKNLSSIVTTRIQLGETDALLAAKRQLVAPGGVNRPAGEGKEEDLQLRKEQARQPFDYQNPIRSQAIDGGIRDPNIINWDGKYYLTGTSYPFTRGNRTGVRLWSSDDLKNWKMEGILIDSSKLPEDVWYRDTFWANEIHLANGKFWLTFNAANMSAEHKAQHSCGHGNRDRGPRRRAAQPVGQREIVC